MANFKATKKTTTNNTQNRKEVTQKWANYTKQW